MRQKLALALAIGAVLLMVALAAWMALA